MALKQAFTCTHCGSDCQQAIDGFKHLLTPSLPLSTHLNVTQLQKKKILLLYLTWELVKKWPNEKKKEGKREDEALREGRVKHHWDVKWSVHWRCFNGWWLWKDKSQQRDDSLLVGWLSVAGSLSKYFLAKFASSLDSLNWFEFFWTHFKYCEWNVF